eukprot:5588759-Amphidinium_carterae.1
MEEEGLLSWLWDNKRDVKQSTCLALMSVVPTCWSDRALKALQQPKTDNDQHCSYRGRQVHHT